MLPEQTQAQSNDTTPLAAAGDAPANPSCVFCALSPWAPCAEPSAGDAQLERVLHSDDHCYVLRDISPAAQLHLLVIPHEHLRDTLSLSGPHRTLLQHMGSVARRVVQSLAPGVEPRLGFHVPPCISVPHLHLHAHAGTWRPFRCVEPLLRPCADGDKCGPCGGCCGDLCGCRRVKYTTWCCWYASLESVQRSLEKQDLRSQQESGPYQQSMGP